MRKLAIALLVVTMASLLGAAAAFADGGPHGKYQATDASGMNSEDKCAGCHRAHTGFASLLKTATVYELCTTCHGGQGGGSSNVLTGRNSTGNLNGGPFVGFAGDPLAVPPIPATTASSIHSVNQGVTTIPDATNPTLVRNLDCTSCHDPHGFYWDSAGATAQRIYSYGTTPTAIYPNAVEQYRMLVKGPNGDGWNGQVLSNESPKSKNTTNWKSGTTQFCASCHDLDAVAQSGTTHRHAVDANLVGTGYSFTTVLPLQHPTGAVSPANDQLVCMTCHKSHGTTTVNIKEAHGSEPPTARSDIVMPNVVIDDATNPTYLLRMNNRGVCQDCHKK